MKKRYLLTLFLLIVVFTACTTKPETKPEEVSKPLAVAPHQNNSATSPSVLAATSEPATPEEPVSITKLPPPPNVPQTKKAKIYFGLFTYRSMEEIEQLLGKKPSILQLGIAFEEERNQFPAEGMEKIRSAGAIPDILWSPAGSTAAGGIASDQPRFQLRKITRGDFDSHIRQFAKDAKNWGHHFFLRFAHEMNGGWYPWSETVNGNARGEYVQMYRHVHDVFETECPRCATWVWAPDAGGQSFTPPVDFAELYPGDEYVDWVGLSAYNVEVSRSDAPWEEFEDIIAPAYEKLQRIAPDKPIYIAETGVVEVGGSKVEWIRNVLPALQQKFQAIKAYSYFDIAREDFPNTVIDSSPEALAAFRELVSDPYFATNEFGEIDVSPIPSLGKEKEQRIIPNSEPSVGVNGWLTPQQKKRADQLISVFENGVPDLQYDYVEYLGDGRGYTVGRGLTTGSGDAYQAAALYSEKVPHNPLSSYLARLKELGDEGSDSISRLEGFTQAWKKAALDPQFKTAQDEINDRNSYNPAMEFADKIGVNTALARVVLYDTVFTHGPGDYPDSPEYLDGTAELLRRTEQEMGGTPTSGLDEKKWLKTFLKIRKADMLNPHNKATQKGWAEASGRVDVFSDFLEQRNLDFKSPLDIKRGYDTVIT